MKTKKIPLRKCIGCGQQFEKHALVRIVKTKQGDVFLDHTGKANGRGAYICKQTECLDLALKRKAVERALETALDETMIASLKAAIAHE